MKIMFFLLTCFATSGCAWQKYNKSNPDAYHMYWCDPKNQKKIVLGIASKVDPQFSQFPQLSHQQCIDNYLQRKYNEKKQRVIEKDRESS